MLFILALGSVRTVHIVALESVRAVLIVALGSVVVNTKSHRPFFANFTIYSST